DRAHVELAARIREALAALLAPGGDPPAAGEPAADALTLERAGKLLRFFAQPFYVAEPYTKRPGVTVGLAESLRVCLEIGTVVHGTTIAVNTLIQRTGARLGLLVTEGFRDVLELQRLRLTNPFDLHGSRPLPLIPRARVAEVRERLRADGRVDTPLDEAGVREATQQLTRAGQGVEGLVISLLHSYRDPAHERQARAIAEAAAPDLPVTASSDVC